VFDGEMGGLGGGGVAFSEKKALKITKEYYPKEWKRTGNEEKIRGGQNQKIVTWTTSIKEDCPHVGSRRVGEEGCSGGGGC